MLRARHLAGERQVASTASRCTARQPLALICSAGAENCPPALFTSTSTRPNSPSARSTRPVTWSSSRISAATTNARRPSSRLRPGPSPALRAPPGEHQVGAATGQLQGGGPADSGAAAGDQGGPPGECVSSQHRAGPTATIATPERSHLADHSACRPTYSPAPLPFALGTGARYRPAPMF